MEQQPCRKRFRTVSPQRVYDEACLAKAVRCLFCKQRFRDAAWLAVHVHSHLTCTFPAQCARCSLVASSEDALVRHIVHTHHAVASRCSVCDRVDTEHECTVECASLVGRRVSVCWFIGKKPRWYSASVTGYNPETRAHTLEYDDEKDESGSSTVEECLSDRFWKLL